MGEFEWFNDFRIVNDGIPGRRYRVCLFDFIISECPGVPECAGKHVHTILSVCNLGFQFTVAWMPKGWKDQREQ